MQDNTNQNRPLENASSIDEMLNRAAWERYVNDQKFRSLAYFIVIMLTIISSAFYFHCKLEDIETNLSHKYFVQNPNAGSNNFVNQTPVNPSDNLNINNHN